VPDIEYSRGESDRNWILSVMDFPRDERTRQTAYAIRSIEEATVSADDGDSFAINPKSLELVLTAAKSTGIGAELNTAVKGGTVTGDCIAILYTLNRFRDYFGQPSLSQTIYLAKCFAIDMTYGDGKPVPKSESKIRECISEYRSVAHLWGAYRMNMITPIFTDGDWLARPEAFEGFLGVAGTLQDFGCNFPLPDPNGSRFLLDSHDIWRIPSEVPRLAPPWKSPPQQFIELLKKYRAKQHD
jgi:hypothetical protein